MSIYLFSANHNTHGLNALEGVISQLQSENCPLKFSSLRAWVLLNTCNRAELYFTIDCENLKNKTRDQQDETKEKDEAREALGKLLDENQELFLPLNQWDFKRGTAVIEHLFAVSAGLESMVVGEREISGQVRRALTVARAQGSIDDTLERIFSQALTTSRKVCQLTGLGGTGRSIVSIALDLAAGENCANQAGEQTRALLVGTGSYAGATIAQLRGRGITNISLLNNSVRSQAFATGHELTLLEPSELNQALTQIDLLVTCRGTGQNVIQSQQIQESLAVRQKAGKAELKIVDLALMRDIAPEVGQMPGVKLIDLQTVRTRVPAAARAQVKRAYDLVAAGVQQTKADLDARRMDPVLVALRETFNQAVQAEISRLPREGQIPVEQVGRALERLAKKLLHTPMVLAQNAGADGCGQQWANALETIWGIEAQVANSDLETAEESNPPAFKPQQIFANRKKERLKNE